MSTRHLALAVAACLLLAVASLLVAHEPVYDAWSWLVWGRELVGLDLDTSSGPSWKPLPVLLAAPLSLAGDGAPDLWLVVTRTSWLLGVVLAGALAHRLTDSLDGRLRLAAAAFAGLSLLLLADDVTMWARQGAAGMSEPVLVTLVLAAVLAALHRRPGLALALAFLAALVRPEVWPLLAIYGLWLWRAEPRLRGWVAAVGIAVPALWFIPDLLASGGAATGVQRARQGDGTPGHAVLEVLSRAWMMPLVAAWPLALLAVVPRAVRGRARGPEPAAAELCARAPEPGVAELCARAPRSCAPRRLPVLLLAAGALAWVAIVAAMAARGFPGLARFMAPAGALAGVAGGVGLARLLALGRERRALTAAACAVLVVATVPQLAGRIGELPHSMTTTASVAHSHDRLRGLVRDIGRRPLLTCGRLATSDVLVRTALAWELEVGLARVVSFGLPPTRSGAFVAGPGTPLDARVRLATHARLLGSRGEWDIYLLGCSPIAAASSSRSAGVSGAWR